MRSLLTYVIFIYYGGSSTFFAAASLTDLSLLSGGYDVDEYLDTHQYQDSPWIVSRFPNAENDGGHFLPIINVEYPITEITPHLGYINHMTIKNQLGNTFIPSVEDETLNTLLNLESYHTSIASSHGLFLPNSDHEIEDHPQHFGPFPMHKKYSHRPISLNVSPHSITLPASHAHVYPVNIQIAKPTTIKEVVVPFRKKGAYHMEKRKIPRRMPNKGITIRKKIPFGNHAPTLKRVVIHRTN